MPGPADQSYGIHVAQLAGLPRKVLRKATKLLNRLEAQGSNLGPTSAQLDLFSSNEESETVTDQELAPSTETELSDKEKDVLDEISNLYLADQTPLQVMQLVENWQDDLKDEK